jgi:hypothetical protein
MANKPMAMIIVGKIILIVHDCLIGFSGSKGSLKIRATIRAETTATK